MRSSILSAATVLATFVISTAAYAHEFWIEPQEYKVSSGATVSADIKVGQDFKGSAQSYLKRRTAQFDVRMGGKTLKVTSRIGDRPAFNQPLEGDGLAVIVHETTNMDLTYANLEKFQTFVDHKAFTTALADHKARGLPEKGFLETYRRYAKSLVAVGTGAGADARVGLRTEIVALANPYTDALNSLPVQVFYENKPRQNTQLEVFEKAPSGTVRIFKLQTDGAGIASVPVRKGHTYMLDAVKLIAGETKGAAWHSMWANLTFSMPQ